MGAGVRAVALVALVLNLFGAASPGRQAMRRPAHVSSGAALKAPALAGLHVTNHALVDGGGHTVRLLGVDRSGTEYACIQGWGIFDGPNDAASVQAIKSWHTNAVRVPLNEDCWLRINGVSFAYGGTNYQNAIVTYVNLLNSYGLYVIMELHLSAPGTLQAGVAGGGVQAPMPDADHSPAFWTSVANTFKGNTNVIFDLFNEPFPEYDSDAPADPWSCWRDGCTFTNDNNWGGAITWTAAGMQSLVDAVRGTGAQNVIMAGGLNWANNESGWLAHEPADATGNLAASWHSYPPGPCNTETCWNAVILPLNQQVPVITGETGDYVTSPATYDPVLLPYLDQHGISYLGWTWDAWPNPDAYVLITDYNGTPTANFGVYFRDHLASLVTRLDAGSSGVSASPSPVPPASQSSPASPTPRPPAG